MSKVYLESSKIKMYPSANRDHSKDIESYLNTEYHITGPKRLSDVIDGWVGARSVLSKDDEIVICLYGYVFFVKKTDIVNHDTIKDWTNVYCGILVDKESTSDNNYRLVNIEDSTNRLVLDDGTYFRGLALTDSKNESGLSYIIEVLRNEGDGEGLKILPSSRCKLDSREIGYTDSNNTVHPITEKFATEEMYTKYISAKNTSIDDERLWSKTVVVGDGGITVQGSSNLEDLYSSSGSFTNLDVTGSATVNEGKFKSIQLDSSSPAKITKGKDDYLLNSTSSLFAKVGKDFVSIAKVDVAGTVARGWDEIGTGSTGFKNDNSDSGSMIKRSSRSYFTNKVQVSSLGGPFSGVLYGSVVPTYTAPVNNALLMNTVTTSGSNISNIQTNYISPLSGTTKKALISYEGKVEYGDLPIDSTTGNLPSSRLTIDANMIATNHSIAIQSNDSSDSYYMYVTSGPSQSTASMKATKFNIANSGPTEMDLTSSSLTFKFKSGVPNTSTEYKLYGISSDYVNIATNTKFNISINGNITTTSGNIEASNGTIQAMGNITSSQGEMYANGYHINSDARLKENLRELTVESSVLDLPTYKFDYKTGKKNQIGCLAQDLQKICPELVEEQENGYLTIQESKLVYLLLEEVKKLRKELDELKK